MHKIKCHFSNHKSKQYSSYLIVDILKKNIYWYLLHKGCVYYCVCTSQSYLFWSCSLTVSLSQSLSLLLPCYPWRRTIKHTNPSWSHDGAILSECSIILTGHTVQTLLPRGSPFPLLLNDVSKRHQHLLENNTWNDPASVFKDSSQTK